MVPCRARLTGVLRLASRGPADEVPATTLRPEGPTQRWARVQVWDSRGHNTKAYVPWSEDDVEPVEQDTAQSATLRGRLVWLDLREPEGRARLAEVTGAIGVMLDRNALANAELRKTLRAVSEQHTVGISFENRRLTDVDLVHIAELTSLRALDLATSTATDAGLAHLKTLTSLHVLNLRYTHVTHAGLAHLEALTALRVLTCRRRRRTLAWRASRSSPTCAS